MKLSNKHDFKVKRPQDKKRKLLKIIIVLAVVGLIIALTISANATPVQASEQGQQTQGNVAPPAIQAEIIGSLLRIVAQDGFYPVEAVFVNERRFNFRVNSALLIDINQYIATGDTIAVYAIDFAGNVSNTILLTPPPPLEPPQPNNLTPEGQGQVVDHATNNDLIEFLTIYTPAGNVFHLVIDHTRPNNNVYFLNAVTEWDLITLAADAELPVPPQISQQPTQPIVTPQEPQPTPEIPDPPVEDESGSNIGLIIFFILGGGAVFGAAYYFKIHKPKQMRQMEALEDADEDEDGEDGEEFDNEEFDEDDADNDGFDDEDDYVDNFEDDNAYDSDIDGEEAHHSEADYDTDENERED